MTDQHKPGCEALGGYGHGVGPCDCGATPAPAQPDPLNVANERGEGWQPIETAPKDGRTLLLGAFNSHGNWRTMRGQWFSREEIDQDWEEPEEAVPGWYETAVEAEMPSVWGIKPTHWMPLPAAPKEKP